LADGLPKQRVADVIGRQLLRAGTSVGANYRAACRARSRAEFIAKLGIVEEEADECLYWLDLLSESGTVHEEPLSPLKREANELLAIIVATLKSARTPRKSEIRNPKSEIRQAPE
jgi:four helix bundle protein